MITDRILEIANTASTESKGNNEQAKLLFCKLILQELENIGAEKISPYLNKTELNVSSRELIIEFKFPIV